MVTERSLSHQKKKQKISSIGHSKQELKTGAYCTYGEKNYFLQSFPWHLAHAHTPCPLYPLILVTFLIDKIESPWILLRAFDESLASFRQGVGHHFL